VQHRLAGAASQVEGAHWLLMRAAWSDTPVDIAAALAQAQSMCTRVGYDLHQFMGAMGLTLEHPLHRWTYRLRLLRTEFGGAEAAFSALAGRAWPET
jgi:alkylation response protein AidB-like acyl-CoA dehydrogenase